MMNQELALQQQKVIERNILRNVYLWMTAGLLLTSFVSLYMSTNREMMVALYSNSFLLWALIIGELVLVMYLSARITTINPMHAVIGFAVYALLNGLTLSYIFLIYTSESIATALFAAAGTFGVMSLFALSTKSDLTSWGHFLHMAVWGLIIASVINIFLKNSTFYWITTYAGVLIFIGLTAYDTQIIKQWSQSLSSSVDEPDYIRLSIMGALKLYLDFINLFLLMLRILGRRR